MAAAAIDREAGGGVRGGCRGVEIALMARDAGERRAGVLIGRGAHVTLVACHEPVVPEERESRLLVAVLHVAHEPGVVRMAAEAVGVELVAVDVGVAGGAGR